MIWPVFASSWSTLSDAERIEGAETILAAGKGGRSAMAIAVQNTAWDVPTSVRYAKHAAAHGADAIVAMPPNNGWNVSDDVVMDYYTTIAKATDLPLIVQTRGTVSVDLMIEDVSADSDDEGDQGRGGRYAGARGRADSAYGQQTGGVGRGRRDRAAVAGVAAAGGGGAVPYAAVADLLQQVMELYWAGKKHEAFDMSDACRRWRRFPARGVHDGRARRVSGGDEAASAADGAGGKTGCWWRGWWRCWRGWWRRWRRRGSTVLTDKEKEAIHYALDVYLKPSLRA